jgi:ubiquinone/menaquinone biosynthesis C-methylase UbiE
VRVWIFIFRGILKLHDEKLKVLDVCAGNAKFIYGLIHDGCIAEGVSTDRYCQATHLNHKFIECDINSLTENGATFDPDLISINNSIQLFSDCEPLINMVNFYKPKYVLITKPTELVIGMLMDKGYQQNTRNIPVRELFSNLGYSLKKSGSVLSVHYKITKIRYMLATLLALLSRSIIIDGYLSKGEYYEYFLFEIDAA